MKFGGSSVKAADRITQVKDIVASSLESTSRLVVVVSALGGVTDHLLNTAKKAASGDESYKEEIDELYYRHRSTAEELLKGDAKKAFNNYLKEKNTNLSNVLQGIYLTHEVSPRLYDFVASYGEVMSSFLIASYMKQELKEVAHADSRKLIRTNSNFMNAKVDFEITNQQIADELATVSGVTVMGGFVSSNEEGVTTTLGRGGSDYTAAIVAAALGAEEIEIWTDVDGVMTTDPRKVKKAFSIPNMTFAEAMEMSHFGAKVLHPPTVQPALRAGIPIRIRNTFNPSFPGTLIGGPVISKDSAPVKGVASINEIALLNIQGSGLYGVTGFAGRLFTALAQHRVNIILITQASSEHSICFAVDPKQAEAAKSAIEEAFQFELKAGTIDEVSIERDLSVVAIIGSQMKNAIGVSGTAFQALARNGINIRAIAQGSSELNISAVVGKSDASRAMRALHDAFFLSDRRSIHVFLLGTGLIGSTLLEQIKQQGAFLSDHKSLEVNLMGVSNSRKMLIQEGGIALDNWTDALDAEGVKADLGGFIDKMKAMNLPNTVFVDCTASAAPISHYKDVLAASISISAANKIANSSALADYEAYQQIIKRTGASFGYETNVGAGLPVLSTLKDLLQSGDQILKIEAVLSGSLSYIFNDFNGERPFSEIVKEAQEKGFTEPDPRDDLSGKDVARKVLILSREIGKPLEFEDIEIENILPESCLNAKTVPAFYHALAANDAQFTEMQQKAAQSGKVLRFLATITPDKSSVSLKAVSSDDPFYGLSGSDNMIVFTTARYKERPLVVKGPGAGADVTAAGVFAELISMVN